MCQVDQHSLQGMSDSWDSLPAKSSVQMVEVPDSTHANGDRTQYEMVDMAYVETEREAESLVHTVANRAHKLKSTVDASLDDVHHCSIFGVLRCNVWRSIVVVLFQNKINLLLPFGPAAAIAASWNMKHVSDQCFLVLFLSLIIELFHRWFSHLVCREFCAYGAIKA